MMSIGSYSRIADVLILKELMTKHHPMIMFIGVEESTEPKQVYDGS